MQQEDFYQRLEFKDRPPDDGKPGPARTVDITVRCTDCWGPVSVTTDDQGRWNHIECRLCGRSVGGDEAEREAAAMWHEAEQNMPAARTGRPSKYRPDAGFVFKLLPDMDRDTGKVDQRIAANLAQGPKRGRLTRHEIPPGTAGYLYAQARALLAGVEQLPEEKSVISHADFHFVEPQISSSDWTEADGKLRLSTSVPIQYRKPSKRTLMARMGTALAAGMASAFACEIGMKAVLVTRLDEAGRKQSQEVHLKLEGGEAAVPWDEVLGSGGTLR